MRRVFTGVRQVLVVLACLAGLTSAAQAATLAAGGDQELSGMSCVSGGPCVTTFFTTFAPSAPAASARYLDSPLNEIQSNPAVSCVSSTLCVALTPQNTLYDFNPSTGAAPVQVNKGQAPVGPEGSFSCVSATLCVGQGVVISPALSASGEGLAFTYNPTANTFGSGYEIHGALVSACASETECTVLGAAGDEGTWDPQASVPYSVSPYPTVSVDPGQTPTAVACPSSSLCVALDAGGGVVPYDPANPGAPSRTVIDAGHKLTAVACPTTGECIAVDDSGGEVTFSPGQPTVNGRAEVASHELSSISCPSSSQCVAGGADQAGVVFDPGHPAPATAFTLGAPATPAHRPTQTPGPAPGPSNRFTHSTPKTARSGTVTETVTVPGKGSLKLSESWRGRVIARRVKTTRGRQRLTITLTPNRTARAALTQHHHARVRLSVSFTPAGGKTRTVTLATRTAG